MKNMTRKAIRYGWIRMAMRWRKIKREISTGTTRWVIEWTPNTKYNNKTSSKTHSSTPQPRVKLTNTSTSLTNNSTNKPHSTNSSPKTKYSLSTRGSSRCQICSNSIRGRCQSWRWITSCRRCWSSKEMIWCLCRIEMMSSWMILLRRWRINCLRDMPKIY